MSAVTPQLPRIRIRARLGSTFQRTAPDKRLSSPELDSGGRKKFRVATLEISQDIFVRLELYGFNLARVCLLI